MEKETRDEFEKVHERISALKQRLTVVETDLPYIRRNVEDIKGSISWFVRLVGGAIILTMLAFLMNGGFKLPV